MPYLTCLGTAGTSSRTKSGIKSRGYHVYRRGTAVHTWWGPIDTNRTQLLSYKGSRKWLGKTFYYRSEKKAREMLCKILAERLSTRGGYTLLRRMRIPYKKSLHKRR
jgi:hypothetical protein